MFMHPTMLGQLATERIDALRRVAVSANLKKPRA